MRGKIRNYLGITEIKWLIVFFVILLVGLFLRMFSLDHGLPWVVGVDEGFEINRALKLALGEIDLERAGKGGLYYLLFIEYGFYYLFLLLSGKVTSPDDFAALFVQDPSMFWMLGRFTVLVLSLLVLFMTYRIGQKFFNVTIGLISMTLVAVSPAMVQNTQYINVDTPMTLLALIIVYLCLNAIDKNKINSMIWGGVLALAVMTKLPAVLLFVPMFITYWYVNRGSSLMRKFANMQVIYFVASFLLIYALTNPAGIIVYGKKIGAFLGIYTPELAVDSDMLLINAGSPINLWNFYFNVLMDGFGIIAFIAGLVGAVLMLIRQRQKAIILMSFPVALFIALAGTSSTHLYYPRYMVPIYPFLAIFAAYFVFLIATQVTKRIDTDQSRLIGYVVIVSCFILAANPLMQSYQWTTKFHKQDTRLEAMYWIEDNVESGAAILMEGNQIRRQSLVLPLKNLASNYDVLIEKMKQESPAKAKYLELEKAFPYAKQYDLHTFRFFEPNESAENYVARGISFFVINHNIFSAEKLDENSKFSNAVKESRRSLYQDLQNTDHFEKVFDISPEIENRSGPRIEIYQVRNRLRD